MENVIAMRTKASIAREILDQTAAGKTFDEVIEWADSDKVVRSLLLREACAEVINDVARSTFR